MSTSLVDDSAADLMTVDEAARRIGGSPRFVRLMATIGVLDCERYGEEIRISADQLADFQARRAAGNAHVTGVLARSPHRYAS